MIETKLLLTWINNMLNMFEHMHFPMPVTIRLNLATDNGMLKWFAHWFRLVDPVPCIMCLFAEIPPFVRLYDFGWKRIVTVEPIRERERVRKTTKMIAKYPLHLCWDACNITSSWVRIFTALKSFDKLFDATFIPRQLMYHNAQFILIIVIMWT